MSGDFWPVAATRRSIQTFMHSPFSACSVTTKNTMGNKVIQTTRMDKAVDDINDKEGLPVFVDDTETGRLTPPAPGESRHHNQGDTDTTEPLTPLNARGKPSNKQADHSHSIWVAGIMVLVGAAITAAFLILAISSAQRDVDLRFEKTVNDVVSAARGGWAAFEGGALWIHEACRPSVDNPVNQMLPGTRICSRERFAQLQQYLRADGLEFQAMAFAPRVNDTLRQTFELEALMYYQQNYPNLLYFGFTGMEPDEDDPDDFELARRSKQPDYLPVHYVEPVRPNQIVVGFDLYSLDANSRNNNRALLESYEPLVSDRINPALSLPPELVIEDSYKPNEYYVVLIHPGIPLPNQADSPPVAALILSVNSIIQSSVKFLEAEDLTVYFFDTSNINSQYLGQDFSRMDKEPINVMLHVKDNDKEPALEDYASQSRCTVKVIPLKQKTWAVVVCHNSGYDPKLLYPILGSAAIMVATCLLALWFYSSQQKAVTIARMTAQAETERAAIIVKSAERAAQQERDLNEYLAHEVRNPLAAAMAAGNFVGVALNEERPLSTDESIQACRGDAHVIQSSLKFIDDLLRSILDMHKAASNQLQIQERPTDIVHDVLETVRTVVDSKHNPWEFQIDCPAGLVVQTDPLKLKQIVMNLATNSRKFVSRGFIKVGAHVKDDTVSLFVEDSGPGIPIQKRSQLFVKYQQSLDFQAQGTGLGLSFCKTLIDLMGGQLYLDETYNSTVPGFPGARFVIALNRPPIETTHEEDAAREKRAEQVESIGTPRIKKTELSASRSSSEDSSTDDCVLPDSLSVLVVDDDMILRRMIIRSFKRIAPSWEIEQAASGETALTLTESKKYDMIFVDQYMASHDRTL
eukprot:scaffold7227_cov160-Amphora_coffeaeformis.AAC.2